MLIPTETYHTCYLIYLFIYFFFGGGGGWGPDLLTSPTSMDTKFRNQENR